MKLTQAQRRELSETVARRVADRVGRPEDPGPSECRSLAPLIDHTLLQPEAREAEIVELCGEALRYGFASACVNPNWISLAARRLRGSPVKVCSVVGFPLGAATSEAKGYETRDAVAKGADEIDMVINVGRLRSGDYDYVARDVEAVVAAAGGRLVKVILETALLSDEEKIAGCVIARSAGARFVKTSTGFSRAGATTRDVRLMRRAVGNELGIKAAGGIRDCESARAMIAAGATRLGTSASVKIVGGEP